MTSVASRSTVWATSLESPCACSARRTMRADSGRGSRARIISLRSAVSGIRPWVPHPRPTHTFSVRWRSAARPAGIGAHTSVDARRRTRSRAGPGLRRPRGLRVGGRHAPPRRRLEDRGAVLRAAGAGRRRCAHPAATAQPGAARRLRPPRRPTRGAPTDAEVRAELKSAFGKDSARSIDSAGLTSNGLATPPPTAPNKLVAIIQAANAVARKPYVYGGGHGRFAGEIFSDSAYDCSGSVSYALAAAGLLDSPMDSSAPRALRQAGARQVGDDLRQRRPRVDDGRGPALRHVGTRPQRLALAGRRARDGGLHRASPARALKPRAGAQTAVLLRG